MRYFATKCLFRLSLDYEEQHSYSIPLVATDAVFHRTFAILSLNVLDENDNAPRFVTQNYESSIKADMQEGEVILIVCFLIYLVCYSGEWH